MCFADPPDLYGQAISPRLAALERVFGKRGHYCISPIPFYLGGDPTIVGFPHHFKEATVFTTSEMTGGWGSGQQPGEHGEYELVIVVPNTSLLAPAMREESRGQPPVFTKGWVGVMLSALAKYSCQATLGHGQTSGPIHPELAPMTNILFAQLPTDRVPFEFGGRRYGLLLCMLINDSEFEFCQKEGSAALLQRFKAAKVFPFSDTSRKTLC